MPVAYRCSNFSNFLYGTENFGISHQSSRSARIALRVAISLRLILDFVQDSVQTVARKPQTVTQWVLAERHIESSRILTAGLKVSSS